MAFASDFATALDGPGLDKFGKCGCSQEYGFGRVKPVSGCQGAVIILSSPALAVLIFIVLGMKQL